MGTKKKGMGKRMREKTSDEKWLETQINTQEKKTKQISQRVRGDK